MTKEQKQRILADWYYNLPARIQASRRLELIKYLDINKTTFYNWVGGRAEISNYVFNRGICEFFKKIGYEYTASKGAAEAL